MIAKCPKCNNSLYVSRDRLGTIVSCSRCNQQIQIQARIASADEDQESLQSAKYAQPNNSSGDSLNVGEGLKRLVLVISFVFGPIIWTLVSVKDLYTLKANFSEPVDNSLKFIILWAIGFVGVWATYIVVRLLISGFGIGKKGSEKPRVLKPLVFLFIASLTPLIPGLWKTIGYMAAKSMWYSEDIAAFFVPGPLIGFIAVWCTFILAVYVGRGFHYKRKNHMLQAMRHRLANPAKDTQCQSPLETQSENQNQSRSELQHAELQFQSAETLSDDQWRTS